MINDMTFEDVRKLLDLSPNATCGYVRVTFVSKHKIAPGGMQAPFADGRPVGSALYFMLTPEEPVKLHRIRNDQLYHYYLGDPIEVLMMLEDGSTEFHIVGPDLRKGHKVQLYIPGGTFHTARMSASDVGSSAPQPNGPAWSPRTSTRQRRYAGDQISDGCRRNPELPSAGEAIERQLRSLTRAEIRCRTLFFPLTQRRAGSSAG